jgi:putative ABC transport system ATP-binding protein
VVFGPSGAGKSTLLRLLNRLDEPTSGTVYLDGTDYRDLPPQEVRKRIGLVPQSPTLLPGSVADNVAWGPRLRDEPVDRNRVDRMLDRLGLDGFSDRAAGELSGGEAQRVAIARTLFNEPDVLLLDEPASSLDATAARQVESLIETTATAFARAAVLVTHDADRARRLGTRGLRLNDGQVRARGSVPDVLPEPAVPD